MVTKLVETKMEDGLIILMLNNPPNNLLNNEFLDSIHTVSYTHLTLPTILLV